VTTIDGLLLGCCQFRRALEALEVEEYGMDMRDVTMIDIYLLVDTCNGPGPVQSVPEAHCPAKAISSHFV